MCEFAEGELQAAKRAVREALAEDLGEAGDITSNAVIPEGLEAVGRFIYREEAVVAGTGVVEEVMRQVGGQVEVTVLIADGQVANPGEVAIEVAGPARALLAAERVAVNFLSHLSGVATLTRLFAETVYGEPAEIFDTRKTIPGLRVLEKYAVRCGGGVNHRMGLFDEVLVKDNHLALMRRAGGAGKLSDALAQIRGKVDEGVAVEVEAKTLEEVRTALAAGVDVIMLDNMTPGEMVEAVALVRSSDLPMPQLEASGGVSLETVAAIAATGVDRISIGALTHSARSVDISLEIE